MNSGAERLGAIRNRDPNRVRRAGSFEPGADAVTQRVWLLLRRPERSRVSRRDDPAKRPGSIIRTGRARETRRRGASGPGKARENSSIERHVNPCRPTAKRKQPE